MVAAPFLHLAIIRVKLGTRERLEKKGERADEGSRSLGPLEPGSQIKYWSDKFSVAGSQRHIVYNYYKAIGHFNVSSNAIHYPTLLHLVEVGKKR